MLPATIYMTISETESFHEILSVVHRYQLNTEIVHADLSHKSIAIPMSLFSRLVTPIQKSSSLDQFDDAGYDECINYITRPVKPSLFDKLTQIFKH